MAINRVFALSLVLFAFFVAVVSCNQKSPAPAAPSGRIQAMDATTTPMLTTSPTPGCVVPNPSGTFPQISTLYSADKCGGASGAVTFEINSLDPPYDYVVVNGTAEEGTTGNVINGASHALYFANFSLPPGFWEGSNGTVVGYIEIYQGTNITNVPLCINGSVLYDIPVERGTAGVYSNPVQFALPKGSLQAGNNTVAFDVPLSPPNTGIVCTWDIYGCLMPVPTSTPGTPTVVASNTPTNTPTPTRTFTPSPTPTCLGADYSATIGLFPQAGQTYSNDTMPINASAQPCEPPLGNTIHCAGCLLSCLSMLVGKDPGTVDAILSNQSPAVFTDSGGLNLTLAADDLGLCSNSSATDVTPGDIVTLMAQNIYLIMKLYNSTSGDTHFVVITGAGVNPSTHQCDFTINDPGSSNIATQYLGKYSLANGWQWSICYGFSPVVNI